MKCPNGQFYSVKYLTYGVSISCDHSRSSMKTLTFYLPSITFRDGWRLRPPKLTMPKMFGVPKALISDQGSQFCNHAMATLLKKYRVVHRVAIAYHPQTNGQAEVFNREIKKLLQKMANPNQNDWSQFLEDALWTHRTTYRTLLGMSPYRLSSIKFELEELCLEAYHNSRIYKQKVKQYHDNRILRKEFRVSQKLIVGKLHSRWDGPFVITNVFPYGAIELRDEANNKNFKVNGHQIKHYYKGPIPIVGKVESISPMEPTIPKDTL
ncbi:pol, partial [Mucuna pruriens]